MFNLLDPLTISTTLDVFMLLVSGRKKRTLIGGSIRVEDPDINKASLRLTTPETIHCNIQTSTLLSVRSSKRGY